MFLRKEGKRKQHSFGFLKLSKTQKRMQNNVAFFKRMQKNAVPNPGFNALNGTVSQNFLP